MSGSTLTALPAATSVAGADLMYLVQGGTSKQVAASLLGTGALTVATATAVAGGQGAATDITAVFVVVTTCPASGGVKLSMTVPQLVMNRGANALLVYPPTGGVIESLSANAPATVPVGSGTWFVPTSSTQAYGT